MLRGMDVTVVHNHEFLLNRQMDKPAAKILQAELEQRGLKFKMAAKLSNCWAMRMGTLQRLVS